MLCPALVPGGARDASGLPVPPFFLGGLSEKEENPPSSPEHPLRLCADVHGLQTLRAAH